MRREKPIELSQLPLTIVLCDPFLVSGECRCVLSASHWVLGGFWGNSGWSSSWGRQNIQRGAVIKVEVPIDRALKPSPGMKPISSALSSILGPLVRFHLPGIVFWSSFQEAYQLNLAVDR